jgi:hypothetical protein
MRLVGIWQEFQVVSRGLLRRLVYRGDLSTYAQRHVRVHHVPAIHHARPLVTWEEGGEVVTNAQAGHEYK